MASTCCWITTCLTGKYYNIEHWISTGSIPKQDTYELDGSNVGKKEKNWLLNGLFVVLCIDLMNEIDAYKFADIGYDKSKK